MDARLTPKSIRQRLCALLGSALLFSTGALAEQPLSETLQIQTFPTHSRLVFRIDDGVPVQWKETKDGFEALFKGLGFTDLGAPLGEEDAWAQQFKKSLRDPRLKSIDLREVPGGLVVMGKWKFPAGPQAPADPRMETFDYREHARKDGGSEFIVDFWIKKGMSVAEAGELKKRKAHEEKLRQAQAEIKNRVSRRLASEQAKSQVNDLGRFCSEPLNEQKDIFLSFLPVSEKIDYQKELPHGAPDAEFPYYEPKGDASDAQYVRLALKLYREEKFGLVVRTLDFMDTEQPSSSYRQEMRFLRANAFLKLGMQAEAERLLNEIKVEAKGKPVALYSALYLATQLLEPVEEKEFRFKDPLAAYETFSWFFTHYPDHRLTWLFHLGAAEALSAIKQTEQAAKEYLWVAENAKTPEQRAQGALRLGNVYLERRQLPQALEAYSRALRYFKKESESYPAIHLNRGEVLYGLGEYQEARKVFEDFAKKYSGYPHGWRASFRLGEIYGRQAGPANEDSSRKWFYDTINHYPLSSGATLARLRLLPCLDHGGFSFESASRFFEGEAKNFDASGEMSMVRYPDLRALAQVRSYITLKREDVAIDVAQREMGLTKVATMKAELGRMYEELFRKNILALLDQNKPYEALKYFEDRSRFRAKDVPVADPDYLLRLSLAASRLGLGKKAEVFAEEYKKAGTPNRAIAQASPKGSEKSLDLRLQVSEQRFAEARALWISGDTSKDSEAGAKNADKIRGQLDQVVAESPYSFEKEVILGLLEEKQGKLKTARGHILKAQVLAPAAKNPENEETSLQILAWLAGVESKAGDAKTALGMYRDLEKRLSARQEEAQEDAEDSDESEEASKEETKSETPIAKVATTAAFLGVAPVPTLEQVLLSQGDLLESMKRWGETALVYNKAVEQGLGGNQALYGYARALLKAGDKASREKAKAALQKLTESKTEDFWKKLAQETLANLQLRDQARRSRAEK
ncbi:MAG: tetratricopeptide repeat protein [Bdellovibrionia bacterium]